MIDYHQCQTAIATQPSQNRHSIPERLLDNGMAHHGEVGRAAPCTQPETGFSEVIGRCKTEL